MKATDAVARLRVFADLMDTWIQAGMESDTVRTVRSPNGKDSAECRISDIETVLAMLPDTSVEAPWVVVTGDPPHLVCLHCRRVYFNEPGQEHFFAIHKLCPPPNSIPASVWLAKQKET